MRVHPVVKTVFFLAALSALFLLIGYAAGGRAGVLFAFVMSLVMNVGAYWFSDKLVLAAHKARELPPDHDVSQIVRELSGAAGLPMPKVYAIPQWAPNAFATGRDPAHAAVAVTEGILKILNREELRGVLAHELGHVKNRDILISTVTATIASAIMYLAHAARWFGFYGGRRNGGGRGGANPLVLLLTVILAPIAAILVQAAISRSRELLADEAGARLSRAPLELASALEKISNPKLIKEFQAGTLLPGMQAAFSHLYIVNHFSAESILGLFSTHPPVRERVERLRQMAGRP